MVVVITIGDIFLYVRRPVVCGSAGCYHCCYLFCRHRNRKGQSSREAKWYYLSGIIANVGLLVFFKYIDFFISWAFDIVRFSEGKIFHSLKNLRQPEFLHIIAPLGISYITFQAIGYLIEIKRGNHKAEKPGLFFNLSFSFQNLLPGLSRGHIIFCRN